MSLLCLHGFCPICQKETEFVAENDWYRDSLSCVTCVNSSVPRDRALALVLEQIVPNWRDCHIHECSPGGRGISAKLRSEATHYIGTQYFPKLEPAQEQWGFRNENLHELTFEDNLFDIFISLDVFEHLPFPDRALKEIYRTLKAGGIMLSTFPVRCDQVDGIERRVDYAKDGSEVYLKSVEIHGNPVNDQGSIVTVDYGYNLHKNFSTWTPFDVEVRRFSDKTHGIIGDYTEVIICRKPG